MGREWAGSPRDPPARPVQGTVQGRRPAGKASSQKAGPRGSAKRCHQAPADRQPEKPRGAQGRAPPRPEGRGQGRRGGAEAGGAGLSRRVRRTGPRPPPALSSCASSRPWSLPAGLWTSPGGTAAGAGKPPSWSWGRTRNFVHSGRLITAPGKGPDRHPGLESSLGPSFTQLVSYWLGPLGKSLIFLICKIRGKFVSVCED